MISIKDIARLLISFGVLWSYHACSVNQNPVTTIVPGLFEIKGKWHVKTEPAKDAIKGYCFRGKDTLYFRRSRLSECQFECPTHDYLFAFRNYHHVTFFDYTFFDQKLHKLYKDSIKVDSIFAYTGQPGMVYPCRGCNAVAKIRFRQSSYLAPHRLDPVLLNRLTTYNFSSQERPTGRSCIFYPVEPGSLPAGCEYIPASMEHVLQLYIHSSMRDEDKIKLLTSITFSG